MATLPTGLINTQQTVAPQVAIPPATTPAQPAQWQVAPEQTVQGQIKNIIDTNSPLMQQAETRGLQEANKRGLLNSTMATQAGQAALYNVAAPIAQADASTYARAGEFNVGQTNQWGLADKSIAAQTARDLAQQGFTQQNMATQQQNVQATMGLQQQFDLAKMDVNAANTLRTMTAQQQNDLAKMAASQGYNLQSMSAQQVNDLSRMAAANQFDLTKMAAASGYTQEQQNNLTANQLIQMAAANGYDLAKMATQQGFNIENMTAQQLNDLAKMDKTFTAQERMAQQKFGYDAQLMGMQQTASKELASTQATYQALLQSSSSATSIMNNTQNRIAEIISNPNMDAAAKQTAIDLYLGNARAALGIIGSVAGDVNLASQLDSILAL